MSARRLLLLLSGLFALSLLVLGLAGSAQGRPGAGAEASTLYGNGYAGPVGAATATSTLTPACPQVWTAVTSQNASGIRNELWGVGGVSDSDAWAVGLYQQTSGTSLPLIERWNGAQWNIAPGAPVTGTGELHALAVLASNNIWAVGTRNRNDSLVEHWDGASWSIVPSPNPGQEFNNPAAVSAVGPNDIWAAGVKGPGSSGTPLVIHWDGTAWTNVTLPTMPGVYSELYGVTALAFNNVWAVGYYNANGGKFTLVIHWDGTTWSIVPSPNYGTSANSLLSVGGAAPNDIWAVGEIAYGASALIEHWDGSAWTVTTTLSNGSLRSVLPISANDVWAVGTRGESQTLSMHWDGASWSIVPSANPDPSGNAFKWVALTPSGGLWGVGYKGAPIEPYHQTLAELYNAPVPPCPPTATPTYIATPADTSTVIVTGTPPTATPIVDCSSVDVHPTKIWPPGAFIYVTVPSGWTWSWDPITNLMRYNCTPQYPTGVSCSWSCSPIEPRVGYAQIHIYDEIGVERCLFGIQGEQTYCPPTDTPTPTITPTPTLAYSPTPIMTTSPSATGSRSPTRSPSRTGTMTPTSTAIPSMTAVLTATPTVSPTFCPIQFSDVLQSSTFYTYVRCLACRGIVNGYADGTFRPNNNVTRGQLSKIVANSAGFSDPQTTQMFQDVPVGSTFQVYIGRLASRGYISGYPCGGAGEPCVSPGSLPYFRPNNNATREQIAKIDANAAGFVDPPSGQTFEDVPPGSTFYTYTQRLTSRSIMQGYQCGGATEPCVPPEDRPYFRPFNNATRGQTSKIVANTFYPNCQTLSR